MQFAAKLISYTFHPIFMPAIGFVLVMGMGVEFVPFMSQEIKSKILFYLVLPFTVYFPISYLILLRLSKNVSSFNLAIRKERIPLFIGTLIFYVAAYVFARSLVFDLPTIYYSMMIGGILSVFLATIITLKWKISVHAMGISGVLGMLFATGEHISSSFYMLPENPIFWPVISFIFLSGAICSSRLILKAHTPGQIYAGLIVGFFCLYLPVKFLIVL